MVVVVYVVCLYRCVDMYGNVVLGYGGYLVCVGLDVE